MILSPQLDLQLWRSSIFHIQPVIEPVIQDPVLGVEYTVMNKVSAFMGLQSPRNRDIKQSKKISII